MTQTNQDNLIHVDKAGGAKPQIRIPGTRIQQLFVIFVLLIHTAWIANHLRWVANEEVNPWKLGGYGMYTVPAPDVLVDIQGVLPSGATGVLNPESYSLRNFQLSFNRTNRDRVLRCKHVGPENLRAFFDENPNLLGANLIFVFLERQFIRKPVGVRRGEQGRVQVEWIGDRHLVYASLFCGDLVTGEVSWP
jgi:hypothetical protein